jgi:hypothetical protein
MVSVMTMVALDPASEGYQAIRNNRNIRTIRTGSLPPAQRVAGRGRPRRTDSQP